MNIYEIYENKSTFLRLMMIPMVFYGYHKYQVFEIPYWSVHSITRICESLETKEYISYNCFIYLLNYSIEIRLVE